MKHNKLTLLLTALLALTCVSMSAQTDATLSQYYEVPAYYNAGGIGLSDNLTIKGGGRLQWMGIDNAPQTFIGSANMPIKLGKQRIAAGLLMQQESLGLYKNLQLGAQVAYKRSLLKGELSVGVLVGIVDQRFKGSEVYIPADDDYHQATDDGIPTTDIGGTTLDLGAGVFYTHKRFWAGASVTHANQPVVTMQAESGAGTSERNYEFKVPRVVYFMAGGNIPVKNTLFEVMPSVMYRTDFQFWTAEATARVRYNKFLTLGLGYRYDNAVYATVGAELKGVFLGYSYDYPTTAIAKASSGSHELIVGYSMKLDLNDKNKNKHKSIRIL